MEQNDSDLIPYLFEVDDEIAANSEILALKTIDDMQLVLYHINLRLDHIRNSKLAINKLNPSILLDIFTFAVYASKPFQYDRSPERTALSISHVCRHWRESALECSDLWTFLNLNYKPSLFDLFVKRSRNAPLTLVWRVRRDDDPDFDYAPSHSYFVSHANSFLPRTHSLNITTTYYLFIRLHRTLLDSGLPFQLRHLNITLRSSYHGIDKPVLPPITHSIDSSFLRTIKLEKSDLPWFQLPINQLTCLKLIDPMNPPALSRLLVFLSNCPSLEVLEIGFIDYDDYWRKTVFDTESSSSPTIEEIDFPNLTTLELRACGLSSYDFVLQFSRRIRSLKTLSRFKLSLSLKKLSTFSDIPHWDPEEKDESDDEEDNDTDENYVDSDEKYMDPVEEDNDSNEEYNDSDERHNNSIPPSLPFQIFEAVPAGIFSHFSNYQYLKINVYDLKGQVKIYGRTSAGDPSKTHRSPLVIQCEGLTEEQIDYSIIHEFLRAMPQVRHLDLKIGAFDILTAQNFDTHGTFPHLHTLQLTTCLEWPLHLLPGNLRVKKLILKCCRVSYKVLFDAALRMEIKALELIKCSDTDNVAYSNYLSELRKRGIKVHAWSYY